MKYRLDVKTRKIHQRKQYVVNDSVSLLSMFIQKRARKKVAYRKELKIVCDISVTLFTKWF